MIMLFKNIIQLKLIPIILWLLIVIWLILIFTLSSQNGAQTAQTSGSVAQKTVEVIYQKPTQQQVNQVHFNIRKLAHIGLFFILGVLSLSASSTTFGWKKKRKYLTVATALVITLGYGFFDEWHKQFISGRHFQPDEAVLNMIAGIIGVIIVALIYVLGLKFKKKSTITESAL